MFSHLPSPVLSVTTDVVKELEGGDAVFALWALFTKCKESLKDGRRLENISWRLWYREIAASHNSPSSSPGSLSPPLTEKRSASPITPISEDGQPAPTPHPSHALLNPAIDLPAAHSWHGKTPTPSFTNGRRSSTATVPMTRPNAPVGVGRFILEILPDKLDVHKGKPQSAIAQGTPECHAPSPMPQIAHPRPVVALPTVQLPLSPPPGTPRVVVVNPTPHPTPPATPSTAHPSGAQLAPQKSTHLLPPAPTRALVTPSTGISGQQQKPTAPEPSAASSPRDAHPARGEDSTLKPSDRRFFLQAESPERDSPEGTSCIATASTTSDKEGQELTPSSAASSQMRSDAASTGAPARRAPSRQQARRNRDVVRRAPARPPLHRTHTHPHIQHQAAQRKAPAPEAKKPAFNIGSGSSNGSRGRADAGASRPAASAAAAQKDPVVSRARQPSPPKVGGGPVQPPRRGIVVSTSSEYETTDTEDDSEWASEENGAGETTARQVRQREETRLREAAEEAQRQRDMFAKVPKRSYSNLNRTRSGLLSQLLNPDPTLFPPNHPYRTSYSTQDLGMAHARRAPALQTSKSSAAIPLAAQVTALAPATNGAGAYVRKGRPRPEELEDSDSGDENPDNAIQLSQSLAQQKLAALAGPSRKRETAPTRTAQQAAPTRTAQQAAPTRPPLPTVATAPIALGHPYNLPAPAAPMTPRATRRQMLSTELSESLRRNLLWERQVSKVNMTSGARRGGALLGGGALRPLTAAHGEAGRTASQSGHESDEQRQRRAGAPRNRSWADDYHYAGW